MYDQQPFEPRGMGTESEMITPSGHLCASLHVEHARRSRPVLNYKITVSGIPHLVLILRESSVCCCILETTQTTMPRTLNDCDHSKPFFLPILLASHPPKMICKTKKYSCEWMLSHISNTDFRYHQF